MPDCRLATIAVLACALCSSAHAQASNTEALDAKTAEVTQTCGIFGAYFALRAEDGAVRADLSPSLTQEQLACAARTLNSAGINVPELQTTPR